MRWKQSANKRGMEQMRILSVLGRKQTLILKIEMLTGETDLKTEEMIQNLE